MFTMKRLRILALCLGISAFVVGLNFMEIRKWTQARATVQITPFKIEVELPVEIKWWDKRTISMYRDHVMTKSTSIHSNSTIFQQFESKDEIKVLSNQKIVIILAYMRTGSSLTGSVLQEYPGTFYLFEPIRAVWEKFGDTQNDSEVGLIYPNGSKAYFQTNARESVVLDEIKKWMTCTLNHLSLNSLTDSFHRQYTKIMKRLQACAVPRYRPYHDHFVKFGNPYPRARKDFWQSCLQKTSDKCREAPIIVLKFIRLPVRMLVELFPLFPNLKVIYLNRDPRGIFNSRSHLRNARERATPEEIQKHCQRWSEDLDICRQLILEYPNRIKTVRYESIADSPNRVFKEISDFVEINFTKEMVHYVRSMTSAKTDGCSYCQQRKNSTITALKWRRQLNFTYANYIYDTCKYGNEVLKYRQFLNVHEMRNLSLPFY